MKKRYLILAGLLVMTVAAAGCGKKKTTETAPVEVTATPTPEVTKAVDMVDMQQTADEDIKNIMGEKTSTASKIVFVNNTGDDIQSLYIRTHVDEDSEDYDADEDGGWGDDLINGMFTLTDKDKALYYMQTANTQTSGTQTSDTQTTSNKSTASYDIRIAYADEDKNECFFRDIPLGTISQITLCMDGTDDDAIPYAKYLTGTSTKEVSTLDAVKERLGITDDSKSESDSTDDSDKNSTDNSDSADNNNSGDQNTDDNGNGSNNGSDDGNGGSTDNLKIMAATEESEKNLSLSLIKFADIIDGAYKDNAPHKICQFIYEVSNAFNGFYHNNKILSEPDEAKKASYIALISLTKSILEQCIDLLAIECPDRM